jgi:TPR repeat protein
MAYPARGDFADGAKAYDGGDYETAFAEWTVLAWQNDTRAQVAIAGMYRSGEGRPVDLVSALRWYRRAAELGDAIGQLNLGEMYSLGLGVARDVVQAHFWLSLAARKGRDWARERRDELATEMTPEQIDQAARLLRDWKPRR